MGRLPSTFADRVIQYRSPWIMAGELKIASGATTPFPDNTFMNNTDKPFEIHRAIPRIAQLDSSDVLLPTQSDQFNLLLALVRANIIDLGKQNPLTKAPTLYRSMVKGSSELTWEFAEPYYLVKGEQIQVSNQALTFPTITDFANARIELSFEGFFIVLAPPSERR